jgi:hypothetical protein
LNFDKPSHHITENKDMNSIFVDVYNKCHTQLNGKFSIKYKNGWIDKYDHDEHHTDAIDCTNHMYDLIQNQIFSTKYHKYEGYTEDNLQGVIVSQSRNPHQQITYANLEFENITKLLEEKTREPIPDRVKKGMTPEL